MVFNQEILEFDKIKEKLYKFSFNNLCDEAINNLHPLFFYEAIKELLDKTKEGYIISTLGDYPSLNTITNLELSLSKLSKNAILTLEEIYDFYYHMEVVNNLKKYVKETKIVNSSTNYFNDLYYFKKYVNTLFYASEVYDNIKNAITPNFGIYDSASPKLKTIRQNIKKTEDGIKEKLNSILKNNASSLSDNYIASRGNHLVLPVRADAKNQIKGIVIDVSSSNNTYFIEPYSVIEANVQLEQLHYEEELEIARITKALCLIINKYNSEIMVNNDVFKELSFMILKGQFGLANNYEVATLEDDVFIDIKEAYHPLINHEVVANDFSLGKENNNIIIISGPNAGGKTVALKTVALITLMNQCGLPLPIKEGRLGVFRDIFIDIGDRQSIEESLSGFTSHISNVSNIINSINKHSLVILDELGSKTDPKEGEALARAIIQYIEKSNCIALITTHYLAIKDYAKEESNITLASMGFENKTFEPTYKLLLNMIGRSYAFEISSRLGLKKEIIDNARSYLDDTTSKLDGIIDEMSTKLKEQEKINQEIKEKEKVINEKLEEVLTKEKAYKEKEKEMYEELDSLKEDLVNDAYKEINDIVKEFKEESEDEYKPHLKNNAINKLNKISASLVVEEEKDETIEVDDDVRIKGSSNIAKVKEIKGNKVTIYNKKLTMVVKLSDLEKVIVPKANKMVKTKHIEKVKTVMPSINLLGKRVDEALIEVRQYLDSALLCNYPYVTIIHGYGTGALRKAIHEYLRKQKFIKEYRLGNYNEGGTGVTIVTFK